VGSLIIDSGSPNGLMAAGSRPDTATHGFPSNEIEAADDFILNSPTLNRRDVHRM